MTSAKFVVLVFVWLIPGGYFVSTGSNETAEILLNLANYAVESRQNFGSRYPYTYRPPGGFWYHQKPAAGQYGLVQSSAQNFARPPLGNFGQFYPPPYPQRPLGPLPNRQSVMDVLYSIARNDKLRCVPRLLCEVTSDTVSRGRQSFSLPSLPINIDMESIIGILSTIDAASGSPITTFAKAALLGYTSKGNSDTCLSNYPRCPRDADNLVRYLNNYNGGFFRFFGGVGPSQNHPANFQAQNYPYSSNLVVAEQRIQNKPVQYVSSNYVGPLEGVAFPPDPQFDSNRSPKTLTFPTDQVQVGFDEFTRRKPKRLPFSINHYYSDELDLQRPLPNHRATPMIFPVRTGTGDLRLDAEELNENYKQPQYNLQNNKFVSFNPVSTNEDFYYAAGGFGGGGDRSNALFTFPQV